MATPASPEAPLGRPAWTGSITFGLVAVPIKLYPATESHSGPVLHMVHREDASRVRLRKFCEAEDRELAQDEIAKGWDTPDGRVVVLTEEDLEQLPVPSKNLVDVLAFLPEGQVSSVALDTPYYCGLGDKAPIKPYRLLAQTMHDSGLVAVTKVTMRSRESLAVLRERDGLLILQTIRWPDEIRSTEGIPVPPETETVRRQEIRMLRSLMDEMNRGYDLDTERDTWAKALQELLAAKAAGGDVQRGDEPARPSVPAMDLMAALRQSIAETHAQRDAEGAPAVGKKTSKRTPRRAS